MSTVRRTFDLDEETDAKLNALAAKKGQDAAAIVADAVGLLDSIVDVEGPDVEEDLRRLREFERSGEAVPLEDMKAWVESWGGPDELARPTLRKVRWFFFHRMPFRISSGGGETAPLQFTPAPIARG
jgi:predicted transcriptional regulator